MSVAQAIIAENLALSRSTVSRSLSGHLAINPITRARVLAKAEELGYLGREHNRGRKVAPRKITTVGVIIATGSFSHSPHPEAGQIMLAGVADAAAARDIMLDTHFVESGNVDDLMNFRRRPAGWRRKIWRGCILIYQHSPEVVAALRQSMPVVSIVNQYDESPLDCIDADPFSGMNALVSELSRAGHKRVGYLSIPPVKVTPSWVHSRFGGFVQAVTRAGLNLIPGAYINVLNGRQTKEHHEVQEVLAAVKNHDLTAIVCATDFLAFRLIAGLAAEGLSVPRDLSITGFDGMPVPHGSPELTTIRNPLHEMGAAALIRLGGRIQAPIRTIHHVLHQGSLIRGCTVSSPSDFTKVNPQPNQVQ